MPAILPALLQTRAYTTRLLSTLYPQRAPAEIDKIVRVSVRRQEILLSEENDATGLLAVVDEAAIRRVLAMSPVEDAIAQISHLREIYTEE